MLTIQRPQAKPSFFYGSIVSYQFRGDVSKDKGTYRIRFSLTFSSGKCIPTQKSGFLTKAEAVKAKEVMIAQLVNGSYIPFDYTFQEFCDYWLYYYQIDEKKIRYNTFTSYRNVLYKYLVPKLGKRKIQQITIDDLVNVISKIAYPHILDNARKIVQILFSDAVALHCVSFNPAIAAAQKLKKITKPKKPRNVTPYTIEQIQLLLCTCQKEFPSIYIPVLLAFCLGTRISETLALKYSDIDYHNGNILITKQISNNIVSSNGSVIQTKTGISQPKTANGIRYVPVPDWVLDEILVKKAEYEYCKQHIIEFHDDQYICCHHNGLPYNRSFLGRNFTNLLKRCGLEHIHFHDIRHIYATVLKNNAVNMKAISLFLGHKTPEFTDAVYVHKAQQVYDCSTLEEEWSFMKPKKEIKNIPSIPFSSNEYQSLFGEIEREDILYIEKEQEQIPVIPFSCTEFYSMIE